MTTSLADLLRGQTCTVRNAKRIWTVYGFAVFSGIADQHPEKEVVRPPGLEPGTL